MRALKIIGLLMAYPKKALIDNLEICQRALADDDVLLKSHWLAVCGFIQYLGKSDLYELQEDYVATFDRGSRCSLHLFEHVYGESRDRGQAMVDLLQAYEEKGLYIDQAELPDYIPLFLEYLSLCPNNEALKSLGEPVDILATIGARLKMRGSKYHVLFDALVSLSNAKVNDKKIADVMAQAPEDESPEAIDKAWEEAAVFGDQSAGDPAAQNTCNGCDQHHDHQRASINLSEGH